MGRRSKSAIRKEQAAAALSFAPKDSATSTLEEIPPVNPAETPQEKPPETPQENFPKATKERLSWPISESGKFDVEGFRKETAEQAREIARKSFLDSDFRKWAGIEQETGAAAEAIFPPTIAGQALDFIASLETLAMARKLGLTYDECHKFMAWNAREHEVLDAQGARLARKYLPAKWLENMDGVIFLVTIGGLAAGKMRMATEFAAKRLEQIGKATDKDMGKTIGNVVPPRAASMTGTPIVSTGENSNNAKPPEQEGRSLE